MSDGEEDSVSEAFSASEDEWKPNKDLRGGESSDDDDSDFEDAPAVAEVSGGGAATSGATRKRETKDSNATKQSVPKKRKSTGQSLRTKLYNKYRPPPKTLNSPSTAGKSSPSASTSHTVSKNAKTPNESNEDVERGPDSSSGGCTPKPATSVDMKELNVSGRKITVTPRAPVVSTAHHSDSGSEDNEESSGNERRSAKAFDFRYLLEKAHSLEHATESTGTQSAEITLAPAVEAAAVDINSLLTLGENRSCLSRSSKVEEDEEEVMRKLNKTKSTRVKRHKKTRPTSTVAAGDTDDSDEEEVAGMKLK